MRMKLQGSLRKRVRGMAVATVMGILLLLSAGLGWGQPTSPSIKAHLQAFTSPDELDRTLKQGLRAESAATDMLPADEVGGLLSLSVTHPDPSLPLAGAGIGQPVAAADTIASDGRYLYVIPDTQIELAYDTGVDPGLAEEDDGSVAAVRILEMIERPPEALPVGKIGLDRQQIPLSGLYLLTEAGKGGEDLLVTVGNKVREAAYFWSSPLDWRHRTTELAVYDVSLPESPRLLTRVEIEGQLIATRRTGDCIHLITRYSPSPPGYHPRPPDPGAVESNQQAIGAARTEDLLPGYRINEGPRRQLLNAETCFKAPMQVGSEAPVSLLTITTVNVSDPQALVSLGVVGLIETLHVSEEALYVASVRGDRRLYGDRLHLGMQDLPVDEPAPQATDLHKFDLTEEGALYRGSGSVEGRIGRTADERPFWIDAYGGDLRVVTWLQSEYGGPVTFRLTLLQEAASIRQFPATLEQVSQLDNLESLTPDRLNIRFSGKFAYLFSRRPGAALRLIDLSNPGQPTVWEALRGVGNVDRLLDLGNGFLVAIGEQSAPVDGASPETAPTAQSRGLRLLLVDGRHPPNPVASDLIDIGGQETQSDACFQRQALYAAISADGSSLSLILPVQLHDVAGSPADADDPAGTATRWIHTGLYLFDVFFEPTADKITGPGFEGPDVIIADQAPDARMAYWALDRGTDRVLVTGKAVHYIHRGKVWSAPLENPAEAIGPR